MKSKYFYLAGMALLFLSACETNELQVEQDTNLQANQEARSTEGPSADIARLQSMMNDFNVQLAAKGANIRIHAAEYMTSPESSLAGQIVYANDRSHRLSTRWVPGDPNRAARGNTITYLVDKTYSTANLYNPTATIDGEPAIDASMTTWGTQTQCSDFPIVKLPNANTNPNYVLEFFSGALVGLPFYDTMDKRPANPFAADIVNTGFLPFQVFQRVFGPSANSILAVCWTLTFVDGQGNTLDSNNDGYADTALKEVWYNDGFGWTTSGTGGIDIETVSLHENGHALEMGHFGKIFRTSSNNRLHFSPQTIMNAAYSGVQRTLDGSATAAHCSLFGSWPNQ